MSDQAPERITSNIESTKSIQPGEEQQSQPGESFKSYMEGGEQAGQAPGKSGGITPFDLAGQGGMAASAAPSMDTLVGQMNSASSVLGDLQNQLHTKNLNLKQSQKYLLRNKLSSANQDIRSAADKAGVGVGEPPPTSARQSPVTKFLGLITDGQEQLNKTQDMIQNMKMEGGSLSPAALLTIQVKLAKAQQELEYSSVLLSKAVDDIKTMFNIQL
ncbi:hypothetical protein [Simkania sp.]|uniref:hypothetical protein n=1 Tax=Simkania sp. TaxID=34094 RepID=UPI003B52C939